MEIKMLLSDPLQYISNLKLFYIKQEFEISYSFIFHSKRKNYFTFEYSMDRMKKPKFYILKKVNTAQFISINCKYYHYLIIGGQLDMPLQIYKNSLKVIMMKTFKKYILLTMLLQLSHFFLPFIPLHPALPPAPPQHSSTVVHVHGLYI